MVGISEPASAQTPSPIQEWQYSSGILLERMFSATSPATQTILGLGAELEPVYSGSRAYRGRGGPMIDIQFQDKAFVSTGDGVGYNLLHKRGLQLGISVAYDLGRKERDDYQNLRGMGDQSFSAVPKAFATWVVSERFPLVVRADWRHLLRSGGGSIGDLGAYLPMPGSSSRFVYFVGPSVTIANRRYLRDSFGVSAAQSIASGHPDYSIPQSGVEAYGVGLAGTWRVSDHYLVNANAAASRLGHYAMNSPIVERVSSHAIAVSIDYCF
jgi:outer membrane scaffolding protein for murein synthesis (MipA/OmpV family)